MKGASALVCCSIHYHCGHGLDCRHSTAAEHEDAHQSDLKQKHVCEETGAFATPRTNTDCAAVRAVASVAAQHVLQ